MYGGKRVEVLNTDAEGRLILADAIARACEDEPDYLIETSTLTGAQTVALGNRTSGVMGSDAFRDRVAAAANLAGEHGWAMPLPPELRAGSTPRSPTWPTSPRTGPAACSSRGRSCGSSCAGGCSGRTSTSPGRRTTRARPWGYTPPGGTGVPVRTLLAALEDIAAGG